MPDQISFSAVDYVVAAITLMVPVSIGLWYAIKDADRTTREEYLLGGRRMSILPVAMSTFITFVSAISVMGSPAEAYFFGAVGFSAYLGTTLSYLLASFTLVPLLYPLRLTSVYEYIKCRYRSEALHLICTIIGMLTTVFYQAIVLLTPALALQACADLPLWISIAVIGTVGTVYTSIGGFKSVIWTDTFQTVMIFVGVFANIVKACIDVDGIGEVWRWSDKGGRINWNKFSFDPRVRHTQWSLVIGYFFMWTTNILSQASVQRISSMKSLRDAKLVFLTNLPLQVVYGAMNFFMGLAIYAYYSHMRCDPYESGLITNKNQLVPYFVLHTMADLPGMAGLFTAVVCSASLSTLSSGINAMAANTVEDILQRPLRSMKEATITSITKLFVVFYGVLAIGLAYLVQSMDGPVTQMAGAVFGAIGSPILGIIIMGSCVPWANKFGALVGVATSLSFNLWVSLGNVLQGTPLKTLPPVTTENCFASAETLNTSLSLYAGTTNESLASATLASSTPGYALLVTAITSTQTGTPDAASRDTFFLFDITYEWYSPMGCVVCIGTGLMVSYFTNLRKRNRAGDGNTTDSRSSYCTDAKYIMPCLRTFWGLTNQKDNSDNNNSGIMDIEEPPQQIQKANVENVETELDNLSPLLEDSFHK